MNFKKIVLATDLSEHSLATMQVAIRIFPMNQQYSLVSAVSDPFLPMDPLNFPNAPEIQEFRKRALEEASESLDTFCREHLSGRYEEQQAFPSNDSPAQATCDYAKRNRADLLVIGSHGAGRLASLFLGTTAQRIISLSPCPVLVIPEKSVGEFQSKQRGLRRILAATDFSEHSRDMLRTLAGRLEPVDEVTIVGVLPLPTLLGWQSEFIRSSVPLAEYFDESGLRAQKLLDAAAEVFPKEAKVATKLIQSQHDVAKLLCEEADSWEADCLALGSAGAGIVANLFLGSTVQAVLKLATRPVLIFPRAKQNQRS